MEIRLDPIKSSFWKTIRQLRYSRLRISKLAWRQRGWGRDNREFR